MMKKTQILLLTFVMLLSACSTPSVVEQVEAANIENETANIPETESEVVSNPVINTEASVLEGNPQSNISVDGLSDTEIEGLLFMREEEKLARDVYLRLYNQWNLPIFQNIAGSESSHMDAILSLLNRFGLEDPAADKDIGEFTNAGLQALYDQLVDQGNQSLSDALKVGAAIEEIDILDLEEYIAQTSNSEIVMVYENLTKGSRNHLRSFTKTIQQQTGEIYTPQYLSLDAYEAIVVSGIESGGNDAGNGNRNGEGRKN